MKVYATTNVVNCFPLAQRRFVATRNWEITNCNHIKEGCKVNILLPTNRISAGLKGISSKTCLVVDDLIHVITCALNVNSEGVDSLTTPDDTINQSFSLSGKSFTCTTSFRAWALNPAFVLSSSSLPSPPRPLIVKCQWKKKSVSKLHPLHEGIPSLRWKELFSPKKGRST